METGLKGKIVFITGAANGIGRATAVAFAREGATLGLVDIDESHGRGQDRSRRRGRNGPHRKGGPVHRNWRIGGPGRELLKATGGAVDVLVNNVGSGAIRTFDQLTDEEWEKTFSLNFMSYVRATRKLLPILRERKGVIVNNGSDLARQPEPVPIDYSASKAAVLALTKGLARAEGKAVRVNAVAPGPIWTPFWTKPGGFAETMGAFHKMEPQAAVEHEMKLRQLPSNALGRRRRSPTWWSSSRPTLPVSSRRLFGAWTAAASDRSDPIIVYL